MNKNKSFTLIELLVVIVIIGILAGVIMISTSSSIDKANLAKAQTFSNTVQEELLLNLISEWTFDEGTDQTIDRVATNNDVKDTWGNNHGILTGTLILKSEQNCVSGKCLESDGLTNNCFSVGQDTYANDLAIQENITIGLWFYSHIASTSGSSLISQRVAKDTYITHGRGITIINNNLRLWSRDKDHIWQEINESIQHNIWNYVVLIQNGNVLTGYLNGKKITALNMNGNMGGSYYGYFRIGNYTNSSYLYDGLIDDVKVYNAALSSASIKQNYIAGLNSMLSNGNISNKEYNERINELAYDK